MLHLFLFLAQLTGGEPLASYPTSWGGHPCSPLWAHVYHPNRLRPVRCGEVVTGTVASVKAEPDGDYHVRLRVDPEFASIVNDVNRAKQKGCLVVEPTCAHRATQKDAIPFCAGMPALPKPKVGSRVRVTGDYVLDEQHGGWSELHPVDRIEETHETIVRNAITWINPALANSTAPAVVVESGKVLTAYTLSTVAPAAAYVARTAEEQRADDVIRAYRGVREANRVMAESRRLVQEATAALGYQMRAIDRLRWKLAMCRGEKRP